MSKILSITAKCSDLCNVSFQGIEHDGYVPENIGIGGGDYIELSIDIETGQIQDWKPLTEEKIITSLNQ